MTRLLPIFLALPLLAHAAPAPQWVKIGSTEGSASYLDQRSIVRAAGDGAHRATSLVSFDATQTTPDGTRYRSMKAQNLYACDTRSTVLLSQSYYPEPMGKGPLGQSFKYEKFAPEDVAPGSAAEGALKLICRR